MPESKQSSSNVGAGAVWILLAAAGTYFVVHTPPLEGNRPATTEAVVRQQPNRQDIESRLWRDPFAVVAERLVKSTDLKPENCGKKAEIDDHCVSPLTPANKSPKSTPKSPTGADDRSKLQPKSPAGANDAPKQQPPIVCRVGVGSAILGGPRIAAPPALRNCRRSRAPGLRSP
jgi:hypothetical protein